MGGQSRQLPIHVLADQLTGNPITTRGKYFAPHITTCPPSFSTVGINPRLNDLKGPGTSKLDWRYFEHNKNDRNELKIRTNSQKGTGTKIAEKLTNFEKFERKKVKFQPCS